MSTNEQALMEFVASIANGDDRIEGDAQHNPAYTMGWNQAVKQIADKAMTLMTSLEKPA